MIKKMDLQQQLKPSVLSETLNKKRKNGYTVFLADELMKPKYSSFAMPTPGETFDKYLFKAGVDVNRTTVQQIMDTDPEYRFLFSEYILTAIFEGLVEDRTVEDLIAAKFTPDGQLIVQPYVKTTGISKTIDATKVVAPGTQFEKEKFEIADKRAEPEKYGKALEIPYETLRKCNLKVFAIFMKGYAPALFLDRKSMLEDVLQNGDNTIDKDKTLVPDTPAIIGVENTVDGITYKDILRVAIRMSMLGRGPDSMIAEEETLLDVLNLPEYKERKSGTTDSKLELKGPLTTPDKVFPSYWMSAKQLMLYARKFGVAEHVTQGLMIETDKIIDRQVEQAVVSMELKYTTFFRDSRAIIDATKEFSSNGFPDWMAVKTPAA